MHLQRVGPLNGLVRYGEWCRDVAVVDGTGRAHEGGQLAVQYVQCPPGAALSHEVGAPEVPGQFPMKSLTQGYAEARSELYLVVRGR